MKRVLTLILAALLIISLLPMAVMADDLPTDQAQVKVYYASKKFFTLTLKADTGAAYVVANDDGTYGQWTGTEAPEDKYVKYEYIAGEPATVKATFKNFNVDSTDAGSGSYTYHTMQFMKGGAPYDIVVELTGDNSIKQVKSSAIYFNEGSNMTITGAGTLSLTQTGAVGGAIAGWGGDLLIKDTTINFNVNPGNSSKHHCIFMATGSVTLDNLKSTSSVVGGGLVWLGSTDGKNARTDVSDDPNRQITIKNCDITLDCGAGSMCVGGAKPIISNSTVKLTKTATGSTPFFSPAPKFEGEYTAVAGLKKNAEKPEKWKSYEEGKLGSYTFFYMVPGIQDLIPTEPVETQPVETQPVETQPVETKPVETKPVETKPVETQPKETQPVETQPAPTEPVEDDAEANPLKIVVIIIVAFIVVAAAAIATLFILRKKGIIK